MVFVDVDGRFSTETREGAGVIDAGRDMMTCQG